MFFVYLWKNKRNRKMYVGSHEGELDDGYIGSGVHFKKAYKKEPENFERVILSVWETREEMMKAEELYLIENNCANSDIYYNLCNVSGGGYLHGHLTNEQREKIKRKRTEASKERLAKMTAEEKQTLAAKKIETLKSSSKYEDYIKKQANLTSERFANISEKEKEKWIYACKNAYWGRPEEVIQQHKMKHSIGSKKSYENNPELRKLRSEIFSKSLKGRKYVNKDGVVKRVHKENLENYLSSGWNIGLGKRKQELT
jgi:hypothetical protein